MLTNSNSNKILPFEIILEALKNKNFILKEEEKKILKKAYFFGSEKHKNQLRDEGTPYFNHCINVCLNIINQNLDLETIIAGLLHDTLEDTDTNEKEIEEEFGKNILFLIQGVTKLGKLKYKGMDRHAESMRKFFIAVAEDIRVVIIKLCDRLNNIQTLQFLKNKEKQERIAKETIEIYAKLADRIGAGKLKSELEDNAFPFAFPNEYKKIENIFQEVKNKNEKHILEIIEKIKEELGIFKIDYLKIDYRIKHLYSLYLKLKNVDFDINKIYDIVAMRIIVKDVNLCYQVLGIIHGLYKPISGRFKDYISLPKPNGYQSLHTTVFDGQGESFEVQIRTQEMHEEAEYGITSHLSYKELGDSKNPNFWNEKLKEKIAWTKDLLKIQENLKDNKNFIENLKQEFLNDKIFIHTPKGEVIELAIGSTLLDFAYHIHSDIGNHTFSGNINGKIANLNTRLKNRDIVEIITKESSHPNRKWLSYTFTSLAKRHIKHYLKENGNIIDKFFS